jgi:hypothetical protein
MRVAIALSLPSESSYLFSLLLISCEKKRRDSRLVALSRVGLSVVLAVISECFSKLSCLCSGFSSALGKYLFRSKRQDY